MALFTGLKKNGCAIEILFCAGFRDPQRRSVLGKYYGMIL